MDFAIELSGVSKHYPGVCALDDISFKVKKGSIHGFLGPNGAGKSTTMNIIAGLIPATSGKVLINGEAFDSANLGHKLGFLPEHPPLYLNMTVEDYLNFVHKLHSLNKKSKNLILVTMEKCGLNSVKNRLIGKLSKGFRQRVGIAQALIYNPEVILLDEPTVGLDPNAISEVRDLIVSLKKEHTIFLSTHLLHEVNILCSDITIIDKGKILQTGALSEIQNTFQTNQVVCITVSRWDEKKYSALSELCQKIEILSQRSNETTLKIYSNRPEDIREDIARQIIALDCGLLSFSEEVVDLEDIFKCLTKRAISE